LIFAAITPLPPCRFAIIFAIDIAITPLLFSYDISMPRQLTLRRFSCRYGMLPPAAISIACYR